MGGVTGMATIAMAILLLGALWSLKALAVAHLCAMLFGVYATAATKPNQQQLRPSRFVERRVYTYICTSNHDLKFPHTSITSLHGNDEYMCKG